MQLLGGCAVMSGGAGVARARVAGWLGWSVWARAPGGIGIRRGGALFRLACRHRGASTPFSDES
ncbi:hypothetical protein DSL92_03435 [Billgrantia gudaonensis]|uniref:Uncharacterized protein n=1 Tax=Billgrantia gudaonensis TaxID=376427 RepID=A0A432JJW7_9GAMM|nr:hypothetical protein DSL92_03435 [Halomonas gudaonensis]